MPTTSHVMIQYEYALYYDKCISKLQHGRNYPSQLYSIVVEITKIMLLPACIINYMSVRR